MHILPWWRSSTTTSRIHVGEAYPFHPCLAVPRSSYPTCSSFFLAGIPCLLHSFSMPHWAQQQEKGCRGRLLAQRSEGHLGELPCARLLVSRPWQSSVFSPDSAGQAEISRACSVHIDGIGWFQNIWKRDIFSLFAVTRQVVLEAYVVHRCLHYNTLHGIDNK